jgi:hypothetical protein
MAPPDAHFATYAGGTASIAMPFGLDFIDVLGLARDVPTPSASERRLSK